MQNDVEAHGGPERRERVNTEVRRLRADGPEVALRRIFADADAAVVEFVGRWEGHDEGVYLTVAAVDDHKRERQLGRLDRSSAVESARWLCECIIGSAGDLEPRVRLRTWAAGGRPEGSLTVPVALSRREWMRGPGRRTETDAREECPAEPRSPTSTSAQLCPGCTGLEAQLAELSRKVAALGDRARASEELGSAIVREVRRIGSAQGELKPVVDESAKAVMQLAGSVRELFEMLAT